MNKAAYKAFRRQYRIAARMAEELVIDQIIYGTAFQYSDETGIYNVPPNEILNDDSGLYIIHGNRVERVVK